MKYSVNTGLRQFAVLAACVWDGCAFYNASCLLLFKVVGVRSIILQEKLKATRIMNIISVIREVFSLNK